MPGTWLIGTSAGCLYLSWLMGCFQVLFFVPMGNHCACSWCLIIGGSTSRQCIQFNSLSLISSTPSHSSFSVQWRKWSYLPPPTQPQVKRATQKPQCILNPGRCHLSLNRPSSTLQTAATNVYVLDSPRLMWIWLHIWINGTDRKREQEAHSPSVQMSSSTDCTVDAL